MSKYKYIKKVLMLNIIGVHTTYIINSHKQWYSKQSYHKYDYNIYPQNVFILFLPQCQWPSFTPIQNNILIFKFLDSNIEEKISAPNDGKDFLTQTALNFSGNRILIC